MEVVFLCPAGGGVGVYGGMAVWRWDCVAVGLLWGIWRCVWGFVGHKKKSKNLSIFALSVGLHGLEP